MDGWFVGRGARVRAAHCAGLTRRMPGFPFSALPAGGGQPAPYARVQPIEMQTNDACTSAPVPSHATASPFRNLDDSVLFESPHRASNRRNVSPEIIRDSLHCRPELSCFRAPPAQHGTQHIALDRRQVGIADLHQCLHQRRALGRHATHSLCHSSSAATSWANVAKVADGVDSLATVTKPAPRGGFRVVSSPLRRRFGPFRRLGLSAHSSARRSPIAWHTASTEHPAWQCTSARPSSPALIDKQGLRSSCAGHRQVHPRSPARGSYPRARSAAGTRSEGQLTCAPPSERAQPNPAPSGSRTRPTLPVRQGSSGPTFRS